MGSNAVRMMVAESHGSAVNILESHRLPLRLGQTVFETGHIPEESIAALVDAFRRFRATCTRHDVDEVRAIATSAMREARNRDQVIERVRDAADVRIEVITGTHEAYLLARAVQQTVDLSQGRSVLVDVGGGSVEVVVVDQGQVIAADSYRLGALRLLQLYQDASEDGCEEPMLDILERHLKGLERRIRDRIADAKVERYVCVGGNIESLAAIVSPDRKAQGVPLQTLAGQTRELAAIPTDERMTRYSLRADRADTIVPAGLVYCTIGEIAGVEEVLVPGVGIKDGLLLELASGHVRPFAAEAHADVVRSACCALGRRFHYEAQHAEQVRMLATRLFDQTHELHRLDEHARILLEAAALLHDIGVAVSNDGHHKHSQYLIEASEIVGLGANDRHLVALVARYHRKAPPTRDHEAFDRLPRSERRIVENLAAILRLADALDRQHASVIADFAVECTPEEIVLRPQLREDAHSRLTLERRAVAQKGTSLERLLGRRITLLAPGVA